MAYLMIEALEVSRRNKEFYKNLLVNNMIKYSRKKIRKSNKIYNIENIIIYINN